MSLDTAAVAEKLLKLVARHKVEQAEACAATNTVTQARLETLRVPKRFGPGSQQLVQFRTADAGVRVVVNGSLGGATTTVLTAKGLANAVERAVANARIAPRDPQFRSLPRKARGKGKRIPFDRRVHAGEVQEAMGDAVEAALARVEDPDMDLAGTLLAFGSTVSYASSLGAASWENKDTGCAALLTAELMGAGPAAVSSGVGFSAARRWGKLDVEAAATEAVELASVRPVHQKVEPGPYTVLLGEYAWADVLDNMLPGAFPLSSAYRGTTWLPVDRPAKGLPRFKAGARLAPETVTIRDEPHQAEGLLSTGTDDEGQPTKGFALLDKGTLANGFDNTYYSYLYEAPVFGRGMRRGDVPGRSAGSGASSTLTNTVQKAGDASMDELVEEAARSGPALYIPRTWYTYPTRIGGSEFSSSNRATSFLVKGRELVPVRPNAFKMTGDIAEMLRTVSAVGKGRKQVTTWGAQSAYLVPKVVAKGVRVERLP